MSEQKHTPEPWLAEGEFKQVGCLVRGLSTEWVGYVVQLNAEKYRGEVCGFQSATNIDGIKPNEALANATRIVSCVNALAGIPNPAEFVRAARELAEAANDEYARVAGDYGIYLDKIDSALSAFRAAGGGQ
jgi:hypothetical protein